MVGAGVAVTGQAVAGCALGAGAGTILGGLATAFLGGAGAFGGAPVGCFTGGVSAVLEGLPQTVVYGIVGGGVTYLWERIVNIRRTCRHAARFCREQLDSVRKNEIPEKVGSTAVGDPVVIVYRTFEPFRSHFWLTMVCVVASVPLVFVVDGLTARFFRKKVSGPPSS
jgi:hypothetical protein